MDKKRRVLWCGEATFMHTGYGVYGRELLSRLHATGKYEIAEFASYGSEDDEKRFSIPWKYYGNKPAANDSFGNEIYGKNKINEFGLWRYEDVLLDFKPDLVIDIRDPWMFAHELSSPLSRFVHNIIMPTVDSHPQQEEWLSMFQQAQTVLTYSEYGRDVLENDGLDIEGVFSPGVNMSSFFPVVDKTKLKELFGLEPDITLIGTIMRNQRRKLIPDLIDSFRMFHAKHPELSKRTFLYLHTSYPDKGYDLPVLLKNSGISHKILFTYICKTCRVLFPAFFQDAKMACPNCSHPTASLPNQLVGASDQQLNQVLNIFDLYVQYSVCEGFGMPVVEAGACAVPVFVVDYSAMESTGKNLKGKLINVERFFFSADEQAYRALPDNNDFVDQLVHFINLSKPMKIKKGRDALLGVKQHYDWKVLSKRWEKLLDNADISNNHSWDSPAYIHEPVTTIPGTLTNDEFVHWAVKNIWGEPNKLNSYMVLRMIRDLNLGQTRIKAASVYVNQDLSNDPDIYYKTFTQQDVVEQMMHFADYRNFWEKKRVGMINETPPSFIVNAKEATL